MHWLWEACGTYTEYATDGTLIRKQACRNGLSEFVLEYVVGVCYKISGWSLFQKQFSAPRRCTQTSTRKCSPAPDLALWKLVFPHVFFSRGVFLFTDARITGWVSVRSIRFRHGSVFWFRYWFDPQGPKLVLDLASCYVNVSALMGFDDVSVSIRTPPLGDRSPACITARHLMAAVADSSPEMFLESRRRVRLASYPCWDEKLPRRCSQLFGIVKNYKYGWGSV